MNLEVRLPRNLELSGVYAHLHMHDLFMMSTNNERSVVFVEPPEVERGEGGGEDEGAEDGEPAEMFD